MAAVSPSLVGFLAHLKPPCGPLNYPPGNFPLNPPNPSPVGPFYGLYYPYGLGGLCGPLGPFGPGHFLSEATSLPSLFSLGFQFYGLNPSLGPFLVSADVVVSRVVVAMVYSV